MFPTFSCLRFCALLECALRLHLDACAKVTEPVFKSEKYHRVLWIPVRNEMRLFLIPQFSGPLVHLQRLYAFWRLYAFTVMGDVN